MVELVNKIAAELSLWKPQITGLSILANKLRSFDLKKGLKIMSEEDLMSDENLKRSLETAKYESWKRYNIMDLIVEYDRMFKDREHFGRFCKIVYESVLEKENHRDKI